MTRHNEFHRPADTGTKAARRLQAAEGYLQLGLPDYALDELSRVEAGGPLEAMREGLTGEALKAARRFDEAILHLRQAIELIPGPLSCPVWISLSECYAAAGDKESSNACLAAAERVVENGKQVEQQLAKLIERIVKRYGPRLAALAKAHNLPKLSVVMVVDNSKGNDATDSPPKPTDDSTPNGSPVSDN
jgi:tetratricopeptide (TPR) repeat protein